MGDLLYEGQGCRKKDLFSAAEMYTKAALSDEPQVCSLGLIFKPVCIAWMLDNLYCSSTGLAQPWPPRWRGFQAATVSAGWTQPLRAVSGRQHAASKHFIQKVCFIICCVYTVHELLNTVSTKSFFSNRCRDSEKTDSYLPCSLSLFSVYLQSIQKENSDAIKVSLISSHTKRYNKND